jgi:hypothetical protein
MRLACDARHKTPSDPRLIEPARWHGSCRKYGAGLTATFFMRVFMRLMRFDSLAGAAAAAVLLAACSDSNAPGNAGTMALRIATTPSRSVTTSAMSPSLVATPLTFNDGAGNILVISDAQVVLKQVSFERADNATACPDGEHDIEHENRSETHRGGSSVAGGLAFDESDQDEADDHDSCAAQALGPLLVDLPLNSGAQQQFSIGIEPGTYTAVRFHIHKANSGAEASFLADHPEFVGSSIRVTGTFNDAPFVYTTSLNVLQRQRFESPVTVDESGSADVTLLVDLSTWFLNGGTLINPATAMHGGANEHLVWDNIKQSFRAFRDHDHDGHADS